MAEANYRQVQLEKQKLLLEQRRKSRQAQSGKVTVNQIGSRPSTSKSSRPSTANSSRPSTGNSSRPSSSKTSIPDPDESSRPSINLITIHSSESLTKKSLSDNETVEECDNVQIVTVGSSSDREPNETSPQHEMVDVSKKLLEMGISSTLGYDSEDSENGSGVDDVSPSNELIDNQPIVPTDQPVIPVVPTDQPVLPVVPADTNHMATSAPTQVENPLGATVHNRMITNLDEVVFKAPVQGTTVKCRITRDKQGVDRFMYPTYYLHLEWDEHSRMLLLAARKKKRARSSYYAISIDPVDMSREGYGFIAKLRANFVGTSFVAYDRGCKAVPTSPTHTTRGPSPTSDRREELVAVQYETNILGFKGPRKMNVVIPCMTKDRERIKVQPINNSETLLDRLKNGKISNLLQLYNKQPVWSEETQAYVLNFHGRVTEASVKNFQLVHPTDEDYVIMQFGRISEDVFTMDYSFPMCAVQAFAVALSSFDSKLACE